MVFSERRFEPKPNKELQDQLRTTSEHLGVEDDSSLAPPSIEEADILSMSIDEIKKRYGRRYEMYVQLLREAKQENNQQEGESLMEMRKWLTALNSLDQYLTNHREGEQTLRERQFTVFEDLQDFVEAGGREGYIKLPTGVGKTVLFSEFVEAMDLRTLIVVPTTLLVTQTKEKLTKYAAGMEVGKVYGSKKEYDKQVTIITYDSLVKQVGSRKINPEDYDCLILDEAHVSLSEQRMKTVQQFESALKIGFTATPEYSSGKKVSDLLETEIHSMSIREAVEEGLLCSLSAVVAKTEVDISQVKVNSAGEYDEAGLEKAVNVAARNKAAVDLYKQNFNDELALAYCVGIKHAEAVAKKFNEDGVPAAHISGEMSPKVQEALLQKFELGEIKMLCNADLLIAGFDEPKVSLCLNLRPTKSRVSAEQRGGRVLRLDPEREDKHATIVDFIDKGIDPRQNPVLFASIVGGVHISSKSRRTGQTGQGGGRTELPLIDVPGLEIIVKTTEVMKIVRDGEKLKKEKEMRTEKTEKITLEDLKNELRAKKIFSRDQYRKERKNHPNWPPDPVHHYDDLESWDDLVGTQKVTPEQLRAKVTLEQLRTEVQSARIGSRREYLAARIKNPHWPENLDIFLLRNPGVNWEYLFGEHSRKIQKAEAGFLSFEDLKREVRDTGVISRVGYGLEKRKHPNWPKDPAGEYGYRKNDAWKFWQALFSPEE